jgi:uncharacterized protein (AIM24 family)
MADIIDYQILGTDVQTLDIALDPGEGVNARVDALIYMDPGVVVEQGEGGAFTTSFTYKGSGHGHVGFGAPHPGSVVPIRLARFRSELIFQRDAFLCAVHGVEVTPRPGAEAPTSGILKDQGFVPERLSGDGLVFLHAAGRRIDMRLGQGERLRVDTARIVGLSTSIRYDVELVIGADDASIGGEVLVATLEGPGRVYLRSLPLPRIAGG